MCVALVRMALINQLFVLLRMARGMVALHGVAGLQQFCIGLDYGHEIVFYLFSYDEINMNTF